MDAASITPNFVNFLEDNVKKHPGKSTLRFNILEPTENLKVSLFTTERGFLMNDEMALFLLDNPDMEINVALVER
jgi:DNA polymerase-3 subunit alpha